MPRVNLQSSTDAVTISNPATSLMVFNTGATLAPAGFYYNAGTPQAPHWVLVLPNPANTNLNMNGFAIENLASPLNPNNAITKDYVYNQIIGVSGSGGGIPMPSQMSDESQTTANLGNAARDCSNLVQNGHSDWYLPSFEEIMYLLSKDAGSISNNSSGSQIWTSTASPSVTNRNIVVRLSDCYSVADYGYSSYYYRCVR